MIHARRMFVVPAALMLAVGYSHGQAVNSAAQGAADGGSDSGAQTAVPDPVPTPDAPVPPPPPVDDVVRPRGSDPVNAPDRPIRPRVQADPHAPATRAAPRGESQSRTGPAPGNEDDGPITGGLSKRLDADGSLDQLRELNVDEREPALAALESRVAATTNATAQLREKARALRPDVRAQVNAAIKEVRARDKDVRKALKAARKAKVEAWAEAREQLAVDFEAYAQAVARAEIFAVRQTPDAAPAEPPMREGSDMNVGTRRAQS